MKNLFVFLALLAMPVSSVLADGRGGWDNDRRDDRRDYREDRRDCFNSREISYQAGELAREARQLSKEGFGFGGFRFGNRFADEAKRLARTSMMLSREADMGVSCDRLENMFEREVAPAFRDLRQEARGPRRPDVNDDLRDISRAFNDLEREIRDHGRDGRGGRGGHGGPGRH